MNIIKKLVTTAAISTTLLLSTNALANTQQQQIDNWSLCTELAVAAGEVSMVRQSGMSLTDAIEYEFDWVYSLGVNDNSGKVIRALLVEDVYTTQPYYETERYKQNAIRMKTEEAFTECMKTLRKQQSSKDGEVQ